MVKKNICAFSTADDKYAISSAISLLSVRDKSPGTDLFLIGRKYSAKTKRLLKKYRIVPIELDLSGKFHTSWDYPVECYYIFAGPDVLHKRGYKYSLYVDGDIYCNNNPFTFSLSAVKDFAGTFTESTIEAILGKDVETAVKLYGNKNFIREKRIQTGIVYFNNSSVTKKDFFNKIVDVYQDAINNNIPRKGDDSLLALFRLAYPTWSYTDLGSTYNKATSNTKSITPKQWLTRDDAMITDSIFFHFTNHTKPWVNTSRFPTYTHEYFYHAWRRHAIDTLTDTELLEYYPGIYAELSDEHLRFYWYPTKNVGDLITPYYLEKVCKVDDINTYSITEHGIKLIERNATYSQFWSIRAKSKLTRGVHSISEKASTAWRRSKPYIPFSFYISAGLSVSQRIRRGSTRRLSTAYKKATRKTQSVPVSSKNTGPTLAKSPNKLRKASYCVSTGSVIRLCGNHAMVYGSGIRSLDQPTHSSSVRFVRGPLTRQRFLDDGHPCAPMYGDPGLLLPRYYTPKTLDKHYRLGLIPHFTEYKDIARQYENYDEVIVIDMACGDLEAVIDQIVACNRTVSSSLHGLVLSHAYGVPTRQIEYSDRIMGDGTKFIDYYGGINLKRIDPINAVGCRFVPIKEFETAEYEILKNYDDTRLKKSLFFDENGFKKSARYPYA